MEPKEHSKILGILFLLHAILYMVVAGLIGIFYFLIFVIAISQTSQESDAVIGFTIVIAILLVVLAFITIVFLPNLLAFNALRKGKQSAQIWVIIACMVELLTLSPLGWGIAIYGIWFLLSETGREYLSNQQFYHQLNQPPTIQQPPTVQYYKWQ